MQRCPNCQTQQIDGTIFCTECGGSLFVATPRQQSTTLISAQQATVQGPEGASEHDLEKDHSETRLMLHVLPSGRKLRLRMQDELLIGRKDDARGIVPDIDLGAEGGYDAGVSRRHAILSFRDGSYYVEDLGSANGTFVNDQQVEAQTRMLLHNGDELRCGMLTMRIDISP